MSAIGVNVIKKIFNESDLIIHRLIHSDKYLIKCTVIIGCKRSFTQIHSLKIHQKLKHPTVFHCKTDNCNKTFGSKSEINEHKKTYHVQLNDNSDSVQDVQIKYECDVEGCENVFFFRLSKPIRTQTHTF